MKIGIIGSSLGDLHLMNHLHKLDHEFHIFLDNRWGERGQLQPEDAEKRLKGCLALAQNCDLIIVPPVYEILILQSNDSEYKKYDQKIVPLFTTLIKTYVLPYSIVGKIGLIGYRHHQDLFQNYWNELKQGHSLTSNQSTNKHFQKQIPLYPLPTDHWSVLYNLPRTWFVNKLIKEDLSKFKDYNIDTLLPLERDYLKYSKVIKQKFHQKIRRYDEKIIFGILNEILETFKSQSSYDYLVNLYYTGGLPLEENKTFKRALERGKSIKINFSAITF